MDGAIERQAFAYEPLDRTKPSIRLIQVSPDLSPEGYVQCTLLHTVVDAPVIYTCVSYVWGSTEKGAWINVDNQPFWVRHNLWCFLIFAQQTHIVTELWIDALCIDQTNSAERNHQVQQMGRIFSKAIEVIAWLGNDENVETYLQRIRENDDSDQKILRKGRDAVIKSKYWDRAWIIQEVFLARKVTLMARGETLPMWRLPWRYYIDIHRKDPKIRDSLHRLLRFRTEQMEDEKVKDLVHLLWVYRGSECSLPQDRIFSLLSLWKEASKLAVDYDMPLEALAINTLRACKTTFCFCTVHIVGDALGLTDSSIMSDFVVDVPFARLIFPVNIEPGPNRGPGRKFVPIGASKLRSYIFNQQWLTIRNKPRSPKSPETTSFNATFCLNDLCPSYGSTREIHITTHKDCLGFSYRYADTEFTPFRASGAELQRTEDEWYWIITITLKFLLEITRQPERDGNVLRMIDFPTPCSEHARWREGETQALELL